MPAVGFYNSPVEKLPSELLGEIFDNCGLEITLPLGEARFPFMLSHVCKSWRTIVLGSPKLWNDITVWEEKRTPLTDMERRIIMPFEACVARSASQPLSLRIGRFTVHPADDAECVQVDITHSRAKLWTLLKAHESRWHKVTISADSIIPELNPHGIFKVPSGTVSLSLIWTASDSQQGQMTTVDLSKAATLWNLRLCGDFSLRMPVPGLTISSLTEVSLLGAFRRATPTCLPDLVSVFKFLPNLLTFATVIGGPVPSSLLPVVEIYAPTLYHLSIFTAGEPGDGRALEFVLQRLRLPAMPLISLELVDLSDEVTRVGIPQLLRRSPTPVQLALGPRDVEEALDTLRVAPNLKRLKLNSEHTAHLLRELTLRPGRPLICPKLKAIMFESSAAEVDIDAEFEELSEEVLIDFIESRWEIPGEAQIGDHPRTLTAFYSSDSESICNFESSAFWKKYTDQGLVVDFNLDELPVRLPTPASYHFVD